MTHTGTYLRILGTLAQEFRVDSAELIQDLVRLDAIATQFLESGISNLSESNNWNLFNSITGSTISCSLVREFLSSIHEHSYATPTFLGDVALITEHLTEVDVDLSHYPSVSPEEEQKLLKVLGLKHPDRLIIVSIDKPDGERTVKYVNTFATSRSLSSKSSDLDTLLSLYLQVNSGASYA